MEESSINYGPGLTAIRGSGLLPKVITCSDEMDEARFIADEIIESNSRGTPFKENTILGRSSYGLRAIEAALISRNIPHQLFGGHSIFKSAHIKDVLSLVRAAGNFRDEIAWMRFLCLYRGVGEAKADSLIKQFLDSSDFKQCSEIICGTDFLPESAKELVGDVASMEKKPVAVYDRIQKGLVPELARIYEKQNWEDRKREIKLVAQIAEKHNSILEFIEEYILSEAVSTSIKDATPPEDVVTLSTIHAMKGSENSIVFLSNISADSCPPAWACNSMEDVEEERRVFYVGLTRAKDSLFLTRRSLNGFSDKKKFFNNLGTESSAGYFLNGVSDTLLQEQFSSTQKMLQTAHAAVSIKRPPIEFGMDFD